MIESDGDKTRKICAKTVLERELAPGLVHANKRGENHVKV